MSSDIAIKATGIGKRYKLYGKPMDRLLDLVYPQEEGRFEAFWALQEVSFEIEKGQTVGIIGRNGSGKSTLLEIIADTLKPTVGEVEVNGRIAALLELGAGFNPEFTGRENVLMNAAIMGIPEATIHTKMEEIVQFANIGDHIYHPVKTYSSGMYVRLAFATSIHMDPDILIVDEALAVGDIGFQRKCFREFEKLKEAGKTILFVTHAVELIRTYCDSAIFLHEGEVRNQGEPRDVVHDYLDMLFGGDATDEETKTDDQAKSTSSTASKVSPLRPDGPLLNTDSAIDGALKRRSYNDAEYRWGDRKALIIDYLVESEGVFDPVVVDQGGQMSVVFKVAYFETLTGLIYGLTIKTLDGTTVYGINTRDRDLGTRQREPGEQAEIRFDFDLDLIPATYFVSIGVALDCEELDNRALDRRYDLFTFSVHSDIRDFGIAQLNGQVEEL